MTAEPKQGKAARRRFVVTILLGSFLLFLVQPMIARMALPRLGGAPAVWNSAMLVYQALLLGGYAYAHAISSLAPRRQAQLHIALLFLAAFWLPIGLLAMSPPANGSPIFWAPWLLLASIGPLFFAVSAQAPLLQRWYGFAGNTGEPYALYAASNIGSFGGLVAYPLIAEPLLPVDGQRNFWSIFYILLLLLVMLCARAIWNALPDRVEQSGPASARDPVTGRQIGYWIILAAVPSGLMLSTTTHLTTDLVAMPLIWVLPLGIYLLSFTVAFSDRRWLTNVTTFFAPPIFLLLALSSISVWGGNAALSMLAGLYLLFVVAVTLHGEMYRTRPDPVHLTKFYLAMAFGGALGGFFCAIIAPLLFDWSWEHVLLILAAAALLPQKRLFSLGEEEIFGPKGWRAILFVMAAICMALGIYGGEELPVEMETEKILLVCLILALGIVIIGNRPAFVVVTASLLLANGAWNSLELSYDDQRKRSYFGIYTINSSPDGRMRWLSHGTTLHGMQMLETPTTPVSYYWKNSGVGLALAKSDRLFGEDARIGIVGLGTGTLACYAKPDQYWEFFEIDPLMVEIARDSNIFSYLANCTPGAQITLGDARLSLQDKPRGSYDLLAIDAFSSDAIPLHLMTREAFEIYGNALWEGGLLLVHISNRYVDLAPVVASLARDGDWHAAIRFDRPPEADPDDGVRSSIWVAMSRDEGQLAALTGTLEKEEPAYYYADRWVVMPAGEGVTPWSDDYASILPHLYLWENLE